VKIISEEYSDSTHQIPQPVSVLFGANSRRNTDGPLQPQRLSPEGEALLLEYEQALRAHLESLGAPSLEELLGVTAEAPPPSSSPPTTSRHGRSGATKGRKKRGR
jgi:hypothetical protein